MSTEMFPRTAGATHVLHVCGDYPYTPLYRGLLSHLEEEKRIAHTMYVPLRMRAVNTQKWHFEADNVRIIYSRDFHEYERFLYHRKRRKIFAAIQRQVPLSAVDLVHAHYLFAAGGVAYAIQQTTGAHYIVAVRNSDMNYFFRWAVHLRGFGMKILRGASRIVFLAPCYRDVLLQKYAPARFRQELFDKSVVIPNGIHEYWFENRHARPPRAPEREIRLLFVGEFAKNKNIDTSIAAARFLRNRGYQVLLTLVGGGPQAAQVKRAAERNRDIVAVHDWTESREELLRFYRHSDVFVMPSFHESFGLVFVEAMSQGLPLILTRGQGIDGHFPPGTVGYACNPLDPGEIADRILEILRDYDKFSANCTKSIDRFSWPSIAAQYEAIYRSLGKGQDAPAL